MKSFLKEPLVHFLAAGLGLFVLFGIVNRDEPDADPNVVTVDHDALLTFVQYRIKAFNPTLAEEKLSSLSDDELQNLIDDYVREEVLHREAVALGLGEDDYVIRRRLVQKLEFITEGFAEAGAKVDQAALRRYFDANKADYYVEPFVTFTHVFFETEDRPREQAHAAAEKKLVELNRNGVPFADAPQHGDRFPLSRELRRTNARLRGQPLRCPHGQGGIRVGAQRLHLARPLRLSVRGAPGPVDHQRAGAGSGAGRARGPRAGRMRRER